MTAGAKGFWAGVVVTAVLAGIVASTTRFEAFVRATGGDQLLLDARLDESRLGRAINIPVATLGEASFVKRSYLLLSTYDFALRVRPGVVGGPGQAVQALTVSVELPGTVTATNATRLAGHTAFWATVPVEGLELHTRTIQWLPIAIVVVALLFTGFYQRS